MDLNILVLPGDGIGTEVTREAVRVLRHVAAKWNHNLKVTEGLLGGIAIHKTGGPLPQETIDLALQADASDPQTLASALERARRELGSLDAVVNAVSASRHPADGPFGGGDSLRPMSKRFRAWTVAVAEQAFVSLRLARRAT